MFEKSIDRLLMSNWIWFVSWVDYYRPFKSDLNWTIFLNPIWWLDFELDDDIYLEALIAQVNEKELASNIKFKCNKVLFQIKSGPHS